MKRFEFQVGKNEENIVVIETDNSKDLSYKLGYFIGVRGLSFENDEIKVLKVEEI